MTNVYCTLFNYDYLVRGLTLYSSMKRCIQRFHLYILAMDPETVMILNSFDFDSVSVVSIEDIMEEDLADILRERKGASFFWTCTPLIIEYVLKKENRQWCTYIDADCFFLRDPKGVFNKIEAGDYSVGVVEHRYRKDDKYIEYIKHNGRFNVAFNVFRNEENSLRILGEWKEQCLIECTDKPMGGSFGDQLYLNEWPIKYERVYIIDNEGIDLAPWNISNYQVSNENDNFIISNKDVRTDVIMYHFHALNFMSKHIISLNLWNPRRRSDQRDLFKLYREYIFEYRKQQLLLDTYFTKQFPNERHDNTVNIRERIWGILAKIKERKEEKLFHILRNIMVV